VQNARDEFGFDLHLKRLIDDVPLRLQMAQAARTRALLFNWDAILGKLVASFRTISDQHSSPQ
jgi:hypothetical protein